MSETSRNKGSVLVVDDQQVMRLLARGSLEQAGFAVVEAENGQKALEVFDSVRPDLVLLDVQMPILDGFETCRLLREGPASRHTPVMMMTGSEDVEAIRRAYEVGATDFVAKPINWLILAHRLGYMLRAARDGLDLRHSRSMLANAQRIANLGYWEWNLGDGVLTCSNELYRIFGLDADVELSSFAALLSKVADGDRAAVEDAVENALEQKPSRAIEFCVPRDEKDTRVVRQRIETVLSEEGGSARLTAIVQDITEQREAEDRIQYLAYYDGLTGLPNRRSFDERLDLALRSASRTGHSLAVVYIDIDRFKRVNETLGHGLGDLLLQSAADRFLRCVRTTDVVGRPGGGEPGQPDLVCRFDGDEFVILLADLEKAEQSGAVARRLMGTLEEDFEVDGQSVHLTASLGIAVHPNDGTTVGELVKNAAAAVSHCKEMGGNQIQYYSESMNATSLEQLKLEAALAKAVDRGELVLYFQPQYDVTTGEIVGAEALLRWNHPERGLIPPATFIPLAEESGLIVPIGEWVVHEACRFAAQWQVEGAPPVRVSVNISSRQVAQAGLEEAVRRALDDSGLAPGLLELELTESTLFQDDESLRDRLDRLSEMGVSLSIDDFGTGYSALSYLARFPLETLKIDRSFVRGTPENEGNAGICRAIVAMAGSLRLRVIAEGVETADQMDFLREQGCFQVQGFLFSRPVPAAEFVELLAGNSAREAAAAG